MERGRELERRTLGGFDVLANIDYIEVKGAEGERVRARGCGKPSFRDANRRRNATLFYYC